jgi:hypothetical protein
MSELYHILIEYILEKQAFILGECPSQILLSIAAI